MWGQSAPDAEEDLPAMSTQPLVVDIELLYPDRNYGALDI